MIFNSFLLWAYSNIILPSLQLSVWRQIHNFHGWQWICISLDLAESSLLPNLPPPTSYVSSWRIIDFCGSKDKQAILFVCTTTVVDFLFPCLISHPLICSRILWNWWPSWSIYRAVPYTSAWTPHIIARIYRIRMRGYLWRVFPFFSCYSREQLVCASPTYFVQLFYSGKTKLIWIFISPILFWFTRKINRNPKY